MLETKDIKAPTLFETEKKAAEEFQETVQKLIADRDGLTKQKEQAKERASVIVGEIDNLKRELNRTLDKNARDSIKKAIAKLEDEQEELQETISLDIPLIMMDKVAESGVYELQVQAKEEWSRWIKEINTYWAKLNKAYQDSKSKLANIRDYNIYKSTSGKLNDLERYLRKEGK